MIKNLSIFLLTVLVSIECFANAKTKELDRIVAIVNSDIIIKSELDTKLDGLLKKYIKSGQESRLPPRSVLEKQVLDKMLIKQMKLQYAKRSGVSVDRISLNKTILGIAKNNGLTIEQFREVLERDSVSYSEFRQELREEIIIQRFEARYIESKVTITDREIDNYLTQQIPLNQNVEYLVEHILIAFPEGVSATVIEKLKLKTEKILQKINQGANFQKMAISYSNSSQALDGGSLGWRRAAQLPSIFIEKIVKMKKGSVAPVIKNSSGFHLIKLVNIRGQKIRIIKQTKARHILIRMDELVSNDEAKNRLNQLVERIEAGESFATIARSNSDDKGSAAKGGSLGWVSPGDLVKRFENEMNPLPVKKISEPFKTRFGWHIVEVLERREHDDTQDYLRNRARRALKKAKGEEEIQLLIRQLKDEGYIKIMLQEES
ncbi:MAG: molecular chaperone SurA [Methylococcales bacterium]|jgi:peptidyl-prolyl cis-trans isomerase SurA|nr:molecular chaperone SurA [Methylococcales bacterium]MBT7409355.1 molecular chaperone SurA [Methylococcales bacterium]